MPSQADQQHDAHGAGPARLWRVTWQERSPVAAYRVATAGALLLLVAAWAPLASWTSSSGNNSSRIDLTGAEGILILLPYLALSRLSRAILWAPSLWAPIFLVGACLVGALWLTPQTLWLARVIRAITALWLIIATAAMAVALYGVLIFPAANAEICQGACGHIMEPQPMWGAWVAVVGVIIAWLGAVTLLRTLRSSHSQNH